MSLVPRYEAIRCETSRKPLIREKPAEVLGTGHQCKDGLLPSIKHNIYESVETFIRIAGLYLGVIPPACILVLSILFCYDIFNRIIYIISAIIHIVIDGKIHRLCVLTLTL
jgi:hypothetical protein